MTALLWLTLAAANPGPDRAILVPVDGDGTSLDAPIQLWLNGGRQFREGERARVQVETRDDGYLVVFNYDTEGRLRVLFPVDPRDDNFVRAGRRYEVRGRGDRESFIVGRDGDGVVYAAVSADPFRFDEFESGGNWDYTRIALDRDDRDPEAGITEILQRMSSDRGFDYDLLTYRVYGYRDYYTNSWWYPRPYGYWDDYYCDPWYRPSLFGCRSYPVGGWYFGLSGYYPYRYGYYGYRDWWYNPWPYRYVTYGSRNYPVLAGRPRGYTIVRRNPSGSVARPGSFGGSLGGRSRPVIDYRPRTEGRRPSGGDRVIDRPSGSSRAPSGSVERPRGRRANPSADRTPAMERERPGPSRGQVDFGGDRGSVTPDAPRRAEPPARRSGGDDGPRVERSPRSEPRSIDRPRSDPPRESPRASRDDGPRRASPQSSRDDGPRRASPQSSRDDGPRRASPPPSRGDGGSRSSPPAARGDGGRSHPPSRGGGDSPRRPRP